jgi:hypothetical protein
VFPCPTQQIYKEYENCTVYLATSTALRCSIEEMTLPLEKIVSEFKVTGH